MNWIPGHFKAYTSWLIPILVWAAILRTNNPSGPLGVGLIITGAFLGDQATHLAQKNHSEEQLTLIETLMRKYRWPFVILGTTIAVIGTLIAIR